MVFSSGWKVAAVAVNCTSSSTVNVVLEAARDTHNPVIIQVWCFHHMFFPVFVTSRSPKAAPHSIVARVSRTKSTLPQLLALLLWHTTSGQWRRTMVSLWWSIQTTVPRNSCRGLTECWRPTRSILRSMEFHCFPATCWTWVKKMTRKTLRLVSNTSLAWCEFSSWMIVSQACLLSGQGEGVPWDGNRHHWWCWRWSGQQRIPERLLTPQFLFLYLLLKALHQKQSRDKKPAWFKPKV